MTFKNPDLITLEERMRESQSRSTLRRIRHTHSHRGHLWFLLGALCVATGLICLGIEVFQDIPNHAVVAGSIIVVVIGAMVIMDWWERA